MNSGGRIGLAQAGFSEPLNSKEVFVLRKVFSKSFSQPRRSPAFN